MVIKNGGKESQLGILNQVSSSIVSNKIGTTFNFKARMTRAWVHSQISNIFGQNPEQNTTEIKIVPTIRSCFLTKRG